MEGSALWQGAVLAGILFWLLSSSYLNLTLKLRSFLQPFVTHYVQTGIPILLQIQVITRHNPANLLCFHCFCFKCWFYLDSSVMQSYKAGFFDALFSGLSCVVSVPFYTAFLPLLFWVRFFLWYGTSFFVWETVNLSEFGFFVEWSWSIG